MRQACSAAVDAGPRPRRWGAGPLAAQVRGIPVYNSGVPRGIGIYGDVGFPNDEAGGGTAYGGDRAGRLRCRSAPPRCSPRTIRTDRAARELSVGATLQLQRVRRTAGPARGHAPGRRRLRQAGRRTPAATKTCPSCTSRSASDFALTIPNPALAIKPWLAPRLDIVRRSRTRAVGRPNTEFGLSGGVELNLLNGLGLHAAYDAVFVDGDPGRVRPGCALHLRDPGL